MKIRIITVFALLTLLLLVASGCGKEASAGESLENRVVANRLQELPGWLLLSHRTKSLSDEQLGFVVKEVEYRPAETEEKDEEGNLDPEPEENQTASSSSVKAGSSGSSAGNTEDEWDSTIKTSTQSSNSGSWWEQSLSNSSRSTGQMEHKINVKQD